MPVSVNIQKLKEEEELSFEGEISVEELEFEDDELVHCHSPLSYNVTVASMEDSMLVQGSLKWPFDCECSRCLKPFVHEISLPDWACHIPLEGEDAAKILNDCVDLTPYMREDTLLRLPLHPLCRPDCDDLPSAPGNSRSGSVQREPDATGASAWNELDKLNLD